MDNFEYKSDTLQCYYEAASKGYDLRKFFEDNGWLDPNVKIAFYAIDEFDTICYV